LLGSGHRRGRRRHIRHPHPRRRRPARHRTTADDDQYDGAHPDRRADHPLYDAADAPDRAHDTPDYFRDNAADNAADNSTHDAPDNAAHHTAHHRVHDTPDHRSSGDHHRAARHHQRPAAADGRTPDSHLTATATPAASASTSADDVLPTEVAGYVPNAGA